MPLLSISSAMARRVIGRLRIDQVGQATAEYALVLLGAAAIALLVVAWATRGGVVGHLLDAVFGHLLSQVHTTGPVHPKP